MKEMSKTVFLCRHISIDQKVRHSVCYGDEDCNSPTFALVFLMIFCSVL